MESPDKTTKKLKERVQHELIEYGFNVIYLTLVFAAYFIHQRLLLASYDITYTHYGVAVIEALVLGKVIMIGSVFRLGRGLEDKPLIYPTIYKSLVFTVFVVVFKVIEHGIRGLWRGEGIMGGLAVLTQKGWELVLANALFVLVAFIPFFAVKELGRVLGEKTVRELFFLRRANPYKVE
jgi:hypothetical protein